MGDDGRLFPSRPLLAASCATVRDGRVLIATRTRPPMDSVWSFPGGLVEPGERLAEAALRELQEETGVEAEIAGFLGHAEFITREADRVKHHFVIVAFAARWVAGDGTCGPEAGAITWATAAEIAALPTTDGLPALAAKALRLVEGSHEQGGPGR